MIQSLEERVGKKDVNNLKKTRSYCLAGKCFNVKSSQRGFAFIRDYTSYSTSGIYEIIVLQLVINYHLVLSR